MGSLTVQVIGDATVGTKSKTFTVSNTDINRFVAACQAKAATAAVPSPTVAQALSAFADSVWAKAKTDTLNFEADAAAAAIQPIAAT